MVLSNDQISMLNEITLAAKAGKLITKTCIDRVTNMQVYVLCIDNGKEIIPVGKLYPEYGIAASEVYTPKGHIDTRILH